MFHCCFSYGSSENHLHERWTAYVRKHIWRNRLHTEPA